MFTYFWQIGGSKRQKKWRMRQQNIFHPPSNETLSHSNGKVVFDHGPYKKGFLDFRAAIETKLRKETKKK